MRNYLWLSILCGLFASTPAWAQGAGQQHSACTDDAYRFCEAQIPVREDVAACLRAHFSALSPACRQEFASGGSKSKHRGRRRR
jgi:hypothetical protein